MKKVSLTDFKKNLDHYHDLAHAELVLITEDDEPEVAMLPYVIYKQFRAALPRQALHVSELSEEDVKAILEAKIPDDDDPAPGT